MATMALLAAVECARFPVWKQQETIKEKNCIDLYGSWCF